MKKIKTFMKKAKYVIGLNDDYEQDYTKNDSNVTYVDRFEKREEDYFEEEATTEVELKVLKTPKMVIKKPLDFSDAEFIVDAFKKGDRVVLDYTDLKGNDRRQVFDFLNGAIFALDGSIEKMSKDRYIYLPKGDFYSEEIEKKFSIK
ncbi:MAG: cell division protein SepF [Tissierellales bacterium]|jgi:cell division inhibitor SepF|nr:cell division protein SepF [Tissierellales bacterium]